MKDGASNPKGTPDPKSVKPAYETPFGSVLEGKIEDALESEHLNRLRGKVNLILTSPPYPLVRKKQYGNSNGQEYLDWLSSLAVGLSDLLADDGSIVVEIGNAWEPGSPTMSTLPLEALMAFKRKANLNLCQHVICHNPARLPSPAAWVNVKRIRLKDSFTHVWWMSKSEYPKADNRKVLNPYSKDMKRLLKRKSYNAGARPSGHVISETGFLNDHGGAIGPNVLDLEGNAFPEALLKYSGTQWDAKYRAYCKEKELSAHPARMQSALSAFFIQFLTDEDDLVFDPFLGSNTTGAVAQELGRRWLGVEAKSEYIEGSKGRFEEIVERA
ncbi:site-specific DNA-methyltransferase [Aliiroseovarius sp. xm-g-7]|uniref:DNA-methyltransferase n=1 Tax=Aliiroseovarius sp. xm-g-7 TaxID=2651826 RepID=UPI00156901DD|nr:site-specific DNA-methyltransferase [Aliiroseovarius sp. xm-g-7]NRQ26010.1 Modification methylase PvuII [Aliiroseovarius sp. xm-g-7]